MQDGLKERRRKVFSKTVRLWFQERKQSEITRVFWEGRLVKRRLHRETTVGTLG